MNRRVHASILLAAIVSTSACAAPSVTVVRRSGPPSALRGMTAVSVSFDVRSMTVDGMPVSDYLAARGAERAEMEEIFAEMNRRLIAGVQQNGGLGATLATGPHAHDGEVQLAVHYLDVVPGSYRGLSAQDGSVHARLVFMVGGEATDELEVTTRSRAVPAEEPTIAGRMQACGLRMGQLAGDHIHEAH